VSDPARTVHGGEPSQSTCRAASERASHSGTFPSQEDPSRTAPPARRMALAFPSKHRIAVTGVSRKPQGHGANVVYQRLRDRGYQTYAVNPNADEVEGDPCYHDPKSIPGGVDAVVIGTRPEIAEQTMHECADLGIRHVWMHRSFGAGGVSNAATAYGRERGITVIGGGCPLLFAPAADPGPQGDALRVHAYRGRCHGRFLRARTTE
jgi:uncharacterized protein